MSVKGTFVFIKKEAAKKGITVTTKQQYRKFWKVLDVILRVVTFGKNKSFMTTFTTTMGNIIAFPEGWSENKVTEYDVITLEHELKHVQQYKKLGLGSVWLGFVIFCILYVFVPLPIGLAWFRYKFERDAYATSGKTILLYGLSCKPNIEYYVDALTGSSYAWAWPFKKRVRRWFLENI